MSTMHWAESRRTIHKIESGELADFRKAGFDCIVAVQWDSVTA